MGVGVLFALTLPGLVVLLVGDRDGRARAGPGSVAAARCTAGSGTRCPPVGWTCSPRRSFPGKAVDLEEQRVREMTRDDVDDGAPPYGRIDLDSGVAYLDPR